MPFLPQAAILILLGGPVRSFAPVGHPRPRPPLTTANRETNRPRSEGEAMAEPSASREAFVEWAVRSAVPIDSVRPVRSGDGGGRLTGDPFLSYLGGAIERSSASVVLLSEGFHNCGEFMSLHHRVIQHLCANCGFRIVGTESGLPESRDIAEYVTSLDREYSDEEKEALWTKGLNKMYSAWAEGRELVEWMRDHNRSSRAQGREMVEYCGLDIGGFYTDWLRPVSKIQSYLKGRCEEFEEEWSRKIQPILDIMGTERARYNHKLKLTPVQKATLAVLLDELVVELDSHGEDLAGDLEFEWARQSAVSMQLAENYYRNLESMSGPGVSKYSGLDGREVAMAHNMMWRLNMGGGDGGEGEEAGRPGGARRKMVVINHIVHTKTATQYQDGTWGHITPMGQLAKQMLKSEQGDRSSERGGLFSVGMVYGGGTFWNNWGKPAERFVDVAVAPKDDGLDATMRRISEGAGMPNFFLHWEEAPAEAWRYLNEVTTVRDDDSFYRVYPLEWNGCIYLDEVSPATPT